VLDSILKTDKSQTYNDIVDQSEILFTPQNLDYKTEEIIKPVASNLNLEGGEKGSNKLLIRK
jgi:hypothetical protein